MFRVWCRPEHSANPLTGRRCRWRVTDCYPDDFQNDIPPVLRFTAGHYKELGILTSKAFKRGSFIRPHKELSKVLAA